MNDTNTGGPAFPRAPLEYIDNGSGLDWAVREQSGMTLRDYFAAKAMPMLATEFYAHGKRLEEGTVPQLVAKVAYEFADAMLEAREA